MSLVKVTGEPEKDIGIPWLPGRRR